LATKFIIEVLTDDLWVPIHRFEFSYTDFDSLIFRTLEFWNANLSDFVPLNKIEYEYDNNQNSVLYSEYSWSENDWVKIWDNQYENLYDMDDNLIERIVSYKPGGMTEYETTLKYIWGYLDIASVPETNEVQITIFPNPTANFVNIQSEDEIKRLILLTTNGQLVQEVSGVYASAHQLDLSRLSSGNYILVIETVAGLSKAQIAVK
jgi:hypothetical protein